MEFTPKIKYPIILSKIIKLAFPFKSKKFLNEYHDWYENQILWHRLGRKPSPVELKLHLSADQFQYQEEVARQEMQQIKNWLPKFIIEKYPRLSVTDSDFPMRFKECLRRIIGGRNYGYNLPIFKAFYHHYLKSVAVKNGSPPHEQTEEFINRRVIEYIEWFKTNKIDKHFFALFSSEIPIWRIEHRMKAQRKNAANSRWTKLKENRKKLLLVLIHRINELSHPKIAKKVKVRIKKMSISHRKISKK